MTALHLTHLTDHPTYLFSGHLHWALRAAATTSRAPLGCSLRLAPATAVPARDLCAPPVCARPPLLVTTTPPAWTLRYLFLGSRCMTGPWTSPYLALPCLAIPQALPCLPGCLLAVPRRSRSSSSFVPATTQNLLRIASHHRIHRRCRLCWSSSGSPSSSSFFSRFSSAPVLVISPFSLPLPPAAGTPTYRSTYLSRLDDTARSCLKKRQRVRSRYLLPFSPSVSTTTTADTTTAGLQHCHYHLHNHRRLHHHLHSRRRRRRRSVRK